MNDLIERDEPAIKKAEFEQGQEPWPLKEFYDESDDVIFIEADNAIIALDYDDSMIMFQLTDNRAETYMMNLLYARKHKREFYDLWFGRGKIK